MIVRILLLITTIAPGAVPVQSVTSVVPCHSDIMMHTGAYDELCEWTLVKTPAGYVPIGQLRIGDSVMHSLHSFSNNNALLSSLTRGDIS